MMQKETVLCLLRPGYPDDLGKVPVWCWLGVGHCLVLDTDRDLLPCRRLFFRTPAIGPTVLLMLGPTAFAGAIPLLGSLPSIALAILPLRRNRLQATCLATKDLRGMLRRKRTVARLQ